MKTKSIPFASALLFVILFFPSACARDRLSEELKVRRPEIGLVPKPLKFERQPGAFSLTAATQIAVPEGEREIEMTARYLAERLGSAFGLELEVSDAPPAENRPLIMFRRAKRTDLGPEGYDLSMTPAAVSLEATGTAGFFYGVQTFLQLLPPEAFGSVRKAAGFPAVPCVRIEDKPRLPWRGMLLDVSRHFFPKDFIKTFIDDLAMHKMNTFHWHLTDDQGWRLEILKYPRLTEVGAWRVDRENRPWNDRPAQQPGEKATYGGFFTQNDIREILVYAESRHVTVIPEIEMPGHCLSVLAAYPQLSCSGGPFTVPPGGVWPIKDVFCPGNEETFLFLENVLSEVVKLFPGEYIHIGGDEVDKSTWRSCP